MKKPNPKHLVIAIVGAGISGLSAALALSQKGFTHVELFERAEKLGEVGAGIQLGPNAVRALRSLGLGESLDRCADSSDWGYMRDGESNQLLTRLPLTEYSQKNYGAPSYQLLRSDLHSLILEQVKQAGILVHTGKKVLRVASPGNADSKSKIDKVSELHFEDGQTKTADLVIGADGINSALANQLYPDYPNAFSGFVCWRAMVDNHAVDDISSVTVWVGEDKHLIAYPVANSTRLNLVGVVARESWVSESRGSESWGSPSQVQPSSVEDWLHAYKDWAPDVLQLIAGTENPQLWGLFERPAMPAWSKVNCVLIGDAAHPMLPSLAQGAAQGIEDAIVLAEVLTELLSKSNNAFELEKVFQQFYKRRHERVERVQQSARWNINYFHQPRGFFRSFRNLSMRLAGPLATALIARRYHWLYRFHRQ